MKAKEYLSQAFYIRQRMKSTEEKLEEIRTKAMAPGAIQYDKVRVQASPASDPLSDYMAAVEKAERTLTGILKEYSEIYAVIERQIKEIQPDVYRQVLAMRYLDGLKLVKIAEKTNYSIDHIKHIHGRALQAFERKFFIVSTK